MPEYKILRVQTFDWKSRSEGKHIKEMERQVREHMAAGWSPLGGISVEVFDGATDAILQTMWRNLPQKQ